MIDEQTRFCAEQYIREHVSAAVCDEAGNWTLLSRSVEEELLFDHDTVRVSVELEEKKNISFVSVKAAWKNKRSFARHRSFFPEKGLVLQLRGMDVPEQLLAHYRHKDWWTRPYFETNWERIPKRTQSLLYKEENEFIGFLPFCDETYTSDLQGADGGIDICLSSYEGGRDECFAVSFAFGSGSDPFQLMEQLAEAVTERKGTGNIRGNKEYPELLEYLGWCSWDAFYQDVHAEGILKKASEWKEKQLPVKWVMIDDGWSQLRDGQLNGFHADTEKFPEGLKGITSILKSQYGVQDVGVWHTLAGYWGGVHPEGEAYRQAASYLKETAHHKYIPHPDAGRGFGFWNMWHDQLRRQGIDFIKVDGQSAIANFLMHQEAIGKAAFGTHHALEASAGIYFNQTVINCMGMAGENIWNRPQSSVARSSDDFVPEDEMGFAEHALQNVYNSFYHGELYWGDWDMFWSKHKDAWRHALLRAVSGGPIYTSDAVGETDAHVLSPLHLKNGRILRCDLPGRPTRDVLMHDPLEEESIWKVWNRCGSAGVVAAFHIHPDAESVKGATGPQDIVWEREQRQFIVYSWDEKKAQQCSPGEKLQVSLAQKEQKLFLYYPKLHEITPIGLEDKYMAPVTFSILQELPNRVIVEVREAGSFLFAADRDPAEIQLNGTPISWSAGNGTYNVKIEPQDEALILEIKL
ncbi:Sip1-related alpha-galactosidase [Alteribacillus sp. HJP-4]|uniref:Sip1-related alpha-galactosidase n=1 Tax=Alteribacillus sp. HJP-4 TaxID=2775394 RepID=UPI0035CCCCAC